MSAIVLRAGRVIDPASQLDETLDVVVRDGRVAALEKPGAIEAGARVIDVRGLWVLPGLVDLRCVLHEQQDLDRALAGGFTTLLADPSSSLKEGRGPKLYRASALFRGSELAEVPLKAPPALSSGFGPATSAGLLRRAMQYARSLSVPVMVHAEDVSLTGRGLLGEGLTAVRLGIPAVPASAEVAAVATTLSLFADVGGRLHLSHLTCQGSLTHLREAKRAGLHVTADVTPHHLLHSDELADGYSIAARVWPPLRQKADVESLRHAVEEGLIDAIATDHLRPPAAEREPPFDLCAPGRDALATALADVLRAGISPTRAVAALSSGPASVFGLNAGRIVVGASGDLTVFDAKAGQVRYTFVAGQLLHGEGKAA